MSDSDLEAGELTPDRGRKSASTEEEPLSILPPQAKASRKEHRSSRHKHKKHAKYYDERDQEREQERERRPRMERERDARYRLDQRGFRDEYSNKEREYEVQRRPERRGNERVVEIEDYEPPVKRNRATAGEEQRGRMKSQIVQKPHGKLLLEVVSSESNSEQEDSQPSDEERAKEDERTTADEEKTSKSSNDISASSSVSDDGSASSDQGRSDPPEEREHVEEDEQEEEENYREEDDDDEDDERRSIDESDDHPDDDDDQHEAPESSHAAAPAASEPPPKAKELPCFYPAIQGCRSVEEFQCINRIEEGTYGVVYRAKEKKTNEIVALKRLKMEKEREGFPITSLREISTILKGQHPNIVTVREIVVGSNMDKIYIVMDFVEHDLKALMENMKQPFTIGEVKTLMIQLLSGVAHLHDNWIIHRDLKTSNLLLSHQGVLKIGDFGLAREYGSPLKPYTPVVVTLWYRAPELLLGTKLYSTPIDLWSVGCIFGELLTLKPLFQGKTEIEQLNKVFKELGTPNENIWPGFSELPGAKKMNFTSYPYNTLRKRFGTLLTNGGFDLLNRFLTYDSKRRITADEALKAEYFKETPLPVNPSMFPTWPAKSEQGHRKASSPKAPSGGKMFEKLMGGEDDSQLGFHMSLAKEGAAAKGSRQFQLKF